MLVRVVAPFKLNSVWKKLGCTLVEGIVGAGVAQTRLSSPSLSECLQVIAIAYHQHQEHFGREIVALDTNSAKRYVVP